MSPPSRRGRAPPGSTPGGPSGMKKSSMPISAMSISGRGSSISSGRMVSGFVRRIGDGDSLDCLARLRNRLLRQRLGLLEAELLDCEHRALGWCYRVGTRRRDRQRRERERRRGGPRRRESPIACRGAHAPRRPRDPERTRGVSGSPCGLPVDAVPCGTLFEHWVTLTVAAPRRLLLQVRTATRHGFFLRRIKRTGRRHRGRDTRQRSSRLRRLPGRRQRPKGRAQARISAIVAPSTLPPLRMTPTRPRVFTAPLRSAATPRAPRARPRASCGRTGSALRPRSPPRSRCAFHPRSGASAQN